MLSNRYFSSEKSTLVENEKIITDDKELAKVNSKRLKVIQL